jgi:hypothetical protein
MRVAGQFPLQPARWFLLAVAVSLAACRAVRPTAPPATAPAAVVALSGATVFIGAGDIAQCNVPGPALTARLVDSVLRAASAADVKHAVFTLGDNAYGAGSVTEFAGCFGPTWGDSTKLIMKNIRPAPGNHDYNSPAADPYYAYFGERAGPRGRGYYSYSLGEWHAVVLNSEIIVSAAFTERDRQAQEEWLKNDLKEHSADCTVAYWHHPRFSSGVHGSDARFRSLWQILHDNNVDLILAGHDHHYERFRPQTADGIADSARGITQMVVGTGGAELRGVGPPIPNSAYQVVGRFGVLLLTLGAKEYQSAFIEVNGSVWDQSGGSCH